MPPTAARDPAAAAPWLAVTLLVLATVLGATGCGQGLYRQSAIPPQTPEGKACLGRCELLRTQCRQRQESRESDCAARYAIAKSDYDLCVKGGTGRCKAPYTCLGADLSICDQEYDGCFTLCGGRIERHLRPLVGDRGDAPASGASAPSAGQPGGDAGATTGGGAQPAKADPP